MLHIKFQTSKPSGSEEEDFFKYFSMYFYSLNLGSPGKEPSWILGPHLNNIGKGLLGNASYPISSK